MLHRSYLFIGAALLGAPALARPVGAQEPAAAFVDVSVIPMDSERVLAHQTVLVRGDKIAAVGPVGRVPVPADAARIDGRGKFLLPGLADMHVHLRQTPDSPEKSLLLLLANGVTTVRDMHSGNRSGSGQDGKDSIRLELRRRVATGELLGPRIYTAGDLDAASPAAAVRSIAELKADGHDFVKVQLDEPTREFYNSVVAAARRTGIRVVGHVPGEVVGVEQVLRDGWASIEHLTGYETYLLGGFEATNLGAKPLAALVDTAAWMRPAYRPDATRLQAIAVATQRAGVWNCPTLKVLDEYTNRPQSDPKAFALMHPNVKMPSGSSLLADPRFRPYGLLLLRLQELNNWMTKALQDAGAGLLLGTDVGSFSRNDVPPGFGVSKELQLLVRAGLTPYQALTTGTRNVAAFLGTLDSTGTVTVGKRADLVLLAGNPLRDIRCTAGPAGVMLGGRWLARAELDARLDSLQSWGDFDLKGVRQVVWGRRAKSTRIPSSAP